MDHLLTPSEVADYLRRPEKTLAMWRYRHIGPPYVKLAGGHVRYRRSAVEKWIDAQSVSTSAHGLA